MASVRSLARTLGIPERTLRRAVNEGLVRGERQGQRGFRTTIREEDYLRRRWALLTLLRTALRTEPSVRLAVLFGSAAVGTDTASSDVDIMVELADDAPARVAQLADRLSRRVERDVQLVRRSDAESSPLLMASILRDGRVLTDRDVTWPKLKRDESRWRRRAAEADISLLDAAPDLA